MREHEFDLEVRYYETDAQGVVHHSNYFRYFELARVKLLEAGGGSYADLEAADVLLVVSKIACKYHSPARYGDTLRIWVRTERSRGARIDHQYRVTTGGRLVADGESTIACINREGQLQRLPEEMVLED